jgi:hypothetical protein
LVGSARWVGTLRPRTVATVASCVASVAVLPVTTASILYAQGDADALVREVRERGVDVLAVEELTPSAVQRLREAELERPSSRGTGT